MLQCMTTDQLDNWLASDRGRIALFLPLAGMVIYGLVLLVRDLI